MSRDYVTYFSRRFCLALFSLILLQFSKMAEKGDKDVKRKGQELWRALKKDPLDRKRIQELLKNRAPTNFREPGTETKRTPLHYVIGERGGDVELLDVLLEHGARTDFVDSFKMTPLHLAAEKGNLQAVKKLVENASCPAVLETKNQSGETAFDIAERKEHWDVVTYLLEKRTGKISLEGDCKVNVSGQGHGRIFNVSVVANNVMVGDHNVMTGANNRKEHNQ
ncbi:ankyrin repeat and death domain-containing protein 1B-like isoform X1 [Acropora muricata]|uniref:ankyrin repeat and death domain-containing protein 1B-like isoform X1 n=1 Tax=Acropora muricata TaxID=159855 RepID=UPI0034E61CCB